MKEFLAGSAGVLGAIIGSFLNVVIYRLPRKKSLGATGRSYCPHCTMTIAWHDNIPILSYLFLLGRCRHCRMRIAPRYLAVEILCALLFVLAYLRAEVLAWNPLWLAFGVGAAYSAISLAAFFIDSEHDIVPNRLTYALAAVGFLGAIGVPEIHGTRLFGADLLDSGIKAGAASLLNGLLGAAIGAGLVMLLRPLAARRLRLRGGHIRLLVASGLLLGPAGALTATGVALALWAVLGVVSWLRGRSPQALGPLLSLGGVAALLYGGEILEFLVRHDM
jgi:leader peptidase (prepilin peptidase)/N-methyltransferase